MNVGKDGLKMPQVTVYKPNGETLLSTNAKKFEADQGVFDTSSRSKDAETR